MGKIKYLSLFIMLLLSTNLFVSCETVPTRNALPSSTGSLSNEDEEKTAEEIEQERLDELARPDNAVKIQGDYCICREGAALSWGSNCDAFCSTRNVTPEQLYLNVEVTEAISERSDIGSFYNWCAEPIIDQETGESLGEPDCYIEAKTPDGSTTRLNIDNLPPGVTSLQSAATSIQEDITYRMKIVVVEPDNEVSSDTVQLRKTSIPITDPIGGPLWTVPVSRYTCLNINTSSDGVSLFFDNASRLYFYFNNETRPDPLSQFFSNIYCHDIILYGTTPRNQPLLEETPGALHLWNALDPRFFDTDGDQIAQIDQLLLQSVQDQGSNLASAPNLFFKFSWSVGPDISTADNDSGSTTATAENADLGYYMTPWIDQTTFKSYCPNADHYNSANQLFRAMRDLVGVDTEGLYIAEQESGSSLILVRESDIKPIWFYKENGQAIEPNDNTITGKKVQFYWPPDPDSPFIRKSHQTTFTVKRADEIGDSVSTSTQGNDGVPSQYPAHDKRIGCIPKL